MKLFMLQAIIRKFVEISEDRFILSSTISNNNHRGNPLDVMTIDPVSQKFYTDMTDDDFQSLGHIFNKECVKFLEGNLLNENKKLQKSKCHKNEINIENDMSK